MRFARGGPKPSIRPTAMEQQRFVEQPPASEPVQPVQGRTSCSGRGRGRLVWTCLVWLLAAMMTAACSAGAGSVDGGGSGGGQGSAVGETAGGSAGQGSDGTSSGGSSPDGSDSGADRPSEDEAGSGGSEQSTDGGPSNDFVPTVEPGASPPGTVFLEDLTVAGIPLGGSAEELRSVLGEPQERGQEPDPCSPSGTADIYSYPGLSVRVIDGQITALSVHGVQWRTARGLQVGDAVERVEQLYPGGREDGVLRIYQLQIEGSDPVDVFGVETTEDRVTAFWFRAVC